MATRFAGSGDTNPSLSKLKEAAIATTLGGVGGAVCGGMLGMFILAPLARGYPGALSRTQYAREYARNGSACFAAWCGIESIMKGIRGKDDLTCCLVSTSGGGLAYSIVSEGLKIKPAQALLSAAAFAVLPVTYYKVRETIRSRNAQDAFYTDARAMLSKLGLEEYEKNLKKGHLTDLTLPLLTDSDLKEVNIPSGARRLILDHIKRHNKMVNRK